ncbi:hypothetical protein FRX31_023724 [Thalictrum thalictroides]|uniref:Uncharacterized protein n=1 Tax=Thalictrum thalictroides TaxID=46969 RepID=A0A7J6VQQ4_THATH|nr:hypothetical protein FRX31_023724 [Thalictrum thalictroides]
MFNEAGVIAQIASGPLSKFCKGVLDPLTVKSWSSETTVYDLRPIRPPYDAQTIIRARMILDVIGFNYGRWYQAEKAMANVNFDDITFKAKAEALPSKVKENSISRT